MPTKIIAIANQKGGVGKTTTCANLGTEIVEAYASGDGIAKTKTLFQYEEDAAGSRWVRVEPVSEKLVNRMRHRGADKKKVKRFSTVSPASKGVKD